jgi:hypothetical protein
MGPRGQLLAIPGDTALRQGSLAAPPGGHSAIVPAWRLAARRLRSVYITTPVGALRCSRFGPDRLRSPKREQKGWSGDN